MNYLQKGVDDLKEAGAYLIENAEAIVSRLPMTSSIDINVRIAYDECGRITINQEVFPIETKNK